MSKIYTGFWKRFLAAIIDSVLLTIIIWPLLYLIYGRSYFEYPAPFGAGFWDYILSYLAPFVITVLFWNATMSTPGKMLIQSKIVDVKTGGKPSVKQWVIRYLCYYVSAIPLGLGFLWVAFDRKKQGWHDYIAGTVVVQSQSPTEQVDAGKPDPVSS